MRCTTAAVRLVSFASLASGTGAAFSSPRFHDVAASAGLHFAHETGFDGRYLFPEIVGGGCAIFDFDGDGNLDVFFVNGGRLDPPGPTTHALFRNRGDGSFEDASARAGLAAAGYGQGCAVADVEGDGDLDLFVTHVGGDRLFRNDGGGVFADVTDASGIAGSGWSTSAAFHDLDGDGDLDLFVARYCLWSVAGQAPCRSPAGEPDYCNPAAYDPAPDVYYRNRGDGTFEDATREAGFDSAVGRGLGVLVDDLDGDGDPDVYVANDGDPNFLWTNDGAGKFTETGLLSGAALDDQGMAEAGMGATSADIDGDGAPELFVTNMVRESNTFYANDGAGSFRDATAERGLARASMPFTGFGARFFDADLDGDADLAVANGAVIKDGAAGRGAWPYAQRDGFYRNDAGRFHGLDPKDAPWLESAGVGRGLATGDLDGDGDTDVVISRAGGHPRLLRNDTVHDGRWIGVRLRQEGPNREGIGSIVTRGSGAGPRWRVSRGESYASASDARIVLGGIAAGDSIAVRWPDGAREFWTIDRAGRDVVFDRGSGRAVHDARASASRRQSPRPSEDSSEPIAMEGAAEEAAPGFVQIPELPSLDEVDEEVAARARASREEVVARPDDAATWKRFGLTLYADLAAEDGAVRALRHATRLDPNDARSHYLLALLAENAGEHEEQRARLERTITLEPHYAPARVRLARLDLADGSSGANAAARAESSLSAALAADSANAGAWTTLARVRREAGRLDEAEAAADRAVALAPSSRSAHHERALVARASGDAETARRVFARAAALPEEPLADPWVAELHFGRGGDAVLLTEGNRLRLAHAFESARRLFRSYVERRPDDAVGWANLAAASRDAGRLDEALGAAERALTLDSRRAESWALRGTLLAARGDSAEAISSLERAVAERPELAPAWFDLGALHKQRGAFEPARECFERCVRLRPADASAWLRLAETRLALGNYDAAATDLAEALELDPANPVAHFRAAGLALRREAPDEAVAHFEAALRARPEWADAHFGLALAHRQAGRLPEAVAAARRAAAIDPQSARFRSFLDDLDGR